MLTSLFVGLVLLAVMLGACKLAPQLPRVARGAAAFAFVVIASMASSMASAPDVTDVIDSAQDTFDAVLPLAISIVTFGIIISIVKLVKKR